ncbi:hypothetical protein AYO38_02825 [bacterium SCGC AG-212-C10]|nr:hypothetical protein AYO38_02825 [bacterium SCGC AG-212-C10]
MLSTEQQRIIDRTRAIAAADARVESLWLSGSLAVGQGDTWSDVDFVVVSRPGETPESLADAYQQNLAAITDVVHSFRPFPRIISAVARDWARFDLLFLNSGELSAQDPHRLQPLLQRNGAAEPGAVPKSEPTRPYDLEGAAREFLRVFGLGPAVIARGHYLMAVDGMGLLRSMCIDLLLAESGKTRADASPKRLESLLTDEQRIALAALPPLSADRSALLAYTLALWGLYLPRAKALAASTGTAWPSEFEVATRQWVSQSLGLKLA